MKLAACGCCFSNKMHELEMAYWEARQDVANATAIKDMCSANLEVVKAKSRRLTKGE